jgi:hypothetical protein
MHILFPKNVGKNNKSGFIKPKSSHGLSILARLVRESAPSRDVHHLSNSDLYLPPIPFRPSHPMTPTGQTRIWHDHGAQFRVKAEYKGRTKSHIHLLKPDGTMITYPLERLSKEDQEYVAKVTDQTDSRRASESKEEAGNLVGQRKSIDWFYFFRNANCDVDDSTVYASVFEREQVGESMLANMETHTLRGFGLREGDILRVMKLIKNRGWVTSMRIEELASRSVSIPTATTSTTPFMTNQSPRPDHPPPTYITNEMLEIHDAPRMKSQEGRRVHLAHSTTESPNGNLQLSVSQLDDSLRTFDSLVSHLISPSPTITTRAEALSTNAEVSSSPAWVPSPNLIDFDLNPSFTSPKSTNIFGNARLFTVASMSMTGEFRPIL